MKTRAARHLVRRFLRSQKGVVALEFALMAPLLISIFMLLVDFGIAMNTKLKLLSALSAGAQYAQNYGTSLTSSNFSTFASQLSTFVSCAADLKSTPTITVKINNTTDGSAAGNWYCVSGTTPSWTQVASSTSQCATNLTAGKFVTLTISTTLSSAFPTDPIVGQFFSLQQSILVRVQ